MRILSVLIAIQGLGYLSDSIKGLINGTMLEYGEYTINSNFNIIGVVLGIWLVASGVGVWFRKRYAYYSIVTTYSLFAIYVIVSLVYMVVVKATIAVLLLMIILMCFLVIVFYTVKHKSEFQRG